MKLHPLPRRAPLIGLGYGAILFFWLSLEDNAVITPVLLGAGAALLIGLRWLLATFGGRVFDRQAWVMGGLIFGACVGAGAALSAAALMLLKTGLHGHAFPDYPFAVMRGMFERTPAWGVAGALIGVGVALITGSAAKVPSS